MGLPFFSGFAFFFILIAALLYFGLKVANKRNWNFLKLGIWGFAFMMLGCFTSYFTTLARSNANVALDMGNVDNPMSLNDYLAREQYGDWPC
jgi:energy-coupling factor transporter transmembrane protein EcfT